MLHKYKFISYKNYLLFFFSFFSIGLIHIISQFCRLVKVDLSSLNLYEWSLFFFLDEKVSEIYTYLAVIPTMFIYYFVCFYIYKNKSSNKNKVSSAIIFYFFLFNIFLTLDIGSGVLNYFIRFLIWIIGLVCFYCFIEKNIKISLKGHKIIKFSMYALLIIVTINFINIFRPLVFEKYHMMNNYVGIPEKTLVNNDYIDNDTYIKNHSVINQFYKDTERKFTDNYLNKEIILTDEERSFLVDNTYEMTWKILDRWDIHHNNHILAPINEIDLGRDYKYIFMQYGFGHALFIKAGMDLMGGINYQNYIKSFYSYFYIYYFLFLFLIFLIFKDIKFVLPIFALTVYSLHKLGYFVYIASGINPLRHFFDIFVLYFSYLYFIKTKSKYLFLAFLFSFLAIFINSQFGMMITLSLVAVIFLKNIFSSFSKIEVFVTIFSFFIAVLCYLFVPKGSDQVINYFFKGFLGLSLLRDKLTFIFLIITTFYIFIIKFWSDFSFIKYIFLISFFYSQALLIYYIWGTDSNHFLIMFPIYIFTFFLFLKMIFEKIKNKKLFSIFYLFLLVFLVILYVDSYQYHNVKINEYKQVFQSHKLYEWNIGKAKIVSTMDQKYFLDSIDLINQYSKQKGIYIISKYDNFLPFLSGKYSKMPVFDLSWYMFSPKEVNAVSKSLISDKPEYLFVDKDIDIESLIIHKHFPYWAGLHKESKLRLNRLGTLRKIFDSVKDKYEVVDHSYLLNVYKRKKKH